MNMDKSIRAPIYSTPNMKMAIPIGRETIIPSQPHCVARAMYDNIAESPDELAFRRGDLLTVLEQNTAGSEGWWLCSLRGRQGICPGNRLRLVAGVFETGGGLHRQHRRGWSPGMTGTTPTPIDRHPLAAPSPTPLSTKTSISDSIYENPGSEAEATQHYDVPRPYPMPATPTPPASAALYDAPRVAAGEWYDAPRTARPASAASHTSAVSRGSTNSACTDTPTQVEDTIQPDLDTYDVPRVRTLPLARNAALDTLDKLQTEASCGVTKLLSLVIPGWRRRESLDSVLLDARVAAARAAAALHDLAHFAGGALANAAHARDKALAPKLSPLVEALREADREICSAMMELDAGGWRAERLARARSPLAGEEGDLRHQDPLDRLVACARSLTIDVQRACSFIQGNSTLLFENDTPTPPSAADWADEYDYVRLEPRDRSDRRIADAHDGTASAADVATSNSVDASLCAEDRRLLAFYAKHAVAYCCHLVDAVDAFLRAVELQQPPRAFLAHAKFVVLNAHRVVYVADTLHRGVKQTSVRAEMRSRADALSDALAAAVAATRGAARIYPAAPADVHNMTRAVAAVSAIASDLKHAMLQAALKT